MNISKMEHLLTVVFRNLLFGSGTLSTTLETKAHVKVSAINVVWDTEKDAVEAELMDILGVDHLEQNHPGLFQQRNAAAKRVIDKMSERERAKLNSIVEERRIQGHPDHIRRE